MRNKYCFWPVNRFMSNLQKYHIFVAGNVCGCLEEIIIRTSFSSLSSSPFTHHYQGLSYWNPSITRTKIAFPFFRFCSVLLRLAFRRQFQDPIYVQTFKSLSPSFDIFLLVYWHLLLSSHEGCVRQGQKTIEYISDNRLCFCKDCNLKTFD